MELAWHPDAQAEYDADVEWYEARVAGLGDRFEAAVNDQHQPLSVPGFPWYY